MAFDNIEHNKTKVADDTTHGLLLASVIDDVQASYMSKHSHIQQPGRPIHPGEPLFPNPNDVQHKRPTSPLARREK